MHYPLSYLLCINNMNSHRCPIQNSNIRFGVFLLSHSPSSPLPSSVSIISPRSALVSSNQTLFTFFPTLLPPPQTCVQKWITWLFELFLKHISLRLHISFAGEANNSVCGCRCECVFSVCTYMHMYICTLWGMNANNVAGTHTDFLLHSSLSPFVP